MKKIYTILLVVAALSGCAATTTEYKLADGSEIRATFVAAE